MKHWIKAFRLRTLPLALSSILMGAVVAKEYVDLDINVLLLSVLTTIFLQVLSNLANDYGDFKNGADHDNRKGPSRAVQAGVISPKAMFNAIIVFVLLSFISGVSLLFVAFSLEELKYVLIFLGLGVLSIIAAIKYTAGNNPYGYMGIGDIFVFIFFGLVGVIGSAYLHTKTFELLMLLPAITIGFLSAGVLNVNNIRDIESDREAGKMSVPVRIGAAKAKAYQYTLIVLAMMSLCLYGWFSVHLNSLFLLSFVIFIIHLIKVYNTKAEDFDPMLKQLALGTFFCSLLCLVSLYISF